MKTTSKNKKKKKRRVIIKKMCVGKALCVPTQFLCVCTNSLPPKPSVPGDYLLFFKKMWVNYFFFFSAFFFCSCRDSKTEAYLPKWMFLQTAPKQSNDFPEAPVSPSPHARHRWTSHRQSRGRSQHANTPVEYCCSVAALPRRRLALTLHASLAETPTKV